MHTRYEPYHPAHDTMRGAAITIAFTPGDLVIAPMIGLTQTHTGTKEKDKGKAKAKDSEKVNVYGGVAGYEGEDRKARANTKAQGDEGRFIDVAAGSTNPMYGIADPPAGTGIAGTSAPASTNAEIGHRNVDAAGHADIAPAWIKDTPAISWEKGQRLQQTFETAALVMAGPMAGTYLGSVTWGVETDADTGTPKLQPLARGSEGTPSREFMASASNWNDATISKRDEVVAPVAGTVTWRDPLVEGVVYPARTRLAVITPVTGAPVEVHLPTAARFVGFTVDQGVPVVPGQRMAFHRVQLDTADLPITSHRSVEAEGFSDGQLDQRMRQLRSEVARADPATPDFQNKRFELRAISRIAVRRGAGAVDSGHSYTTKPGDTLAGIAAARLRDASRWTQIMALNAAELQDRIEIGAGIALKMPRSDEP